MLEVYFNIIEWGPNVYGIGGPAVLLQKSPSELTLNECLYHELFPVQENSCINLMTKENLGILPQHRKGF
jgi:membrane carboxypeptidase/penicillin-binding protein